MGELHLEVVVDRLCASSASSQTSVGRRSPIARRSVRPSSKTAGSSSTQAGRPNAEVSLRLEPLPAGHGYEFVDALAGEAVPADAVPAVDQGVREQMAAGVIAGYPVADVKVTLTAERTPGSNRAPRRSRSPAPTAFKEGMRKARPALLEPIMNVEVVMPQSYVGDVSGDLSRRRGVLQRIEDAPAGKIIRARVPLSEMFGYATALRSLSQGRATYTMEFSQYAEAPAKVSQHVIKDRAA